MSTSLLTSRPDIYNNLEIKALAFLINLADSSERYEDSYTLLKTLINKRTSSATALTKKEMKYLSNAFRYNFGSIRASIRSLKQNDDTELITHEVSVYVTILTKELHSLCNDYMPVISSQLIPNAEKLNNYPNVCDGYKLLSNCYRYKCEHILSSNPIEIQNNIDRAHELYVQCIDLCQKHLQITDYIYLSSSLCYAVFHVDILKDYNTAIDICKNTFDACMDALTDEPNSEIEYVLQYMRDNITLWKEDAELQKEKGNLGTLDDNDGINIRKYGKRAKAKRHNPNNEQDMHDLKADLKKLGLMSQNKSDPNSEKDEIRQNLRGLLVEISSEESEGLYKDIIDLILEYEAYIDLSRHKCVECKEYFGCDVFDNLCSECYANKYGKKVMKEICKNNLESIAVRIEWDDIVARQRYYSLISMPSLCSIKIYFRILSYNSYRGKCLDVLNNDNQTLLSVEKYDRFKESEETVEDRNAKARNERCVTDFGIIALSAMLLRR